MGRGGERGPQGGGSAGEPRAAAAAGSRAALGGEHGRRAHLPPGRTWGAGFDLDCVCPSWG